MTSTELTQQITVHMSMAVSALEIGDIATVIIHLRIANAAALELQRMSVGCGAPGRMP